MERTLTRWYPLALLLIGLGVYANSLQGGHFILDDEPSITANFDIRQILPLWRDPDRTTNAPVNNRPVVRLSLALNYAWGELNIRGYRLFNLGIHLLCGVVLFAVVRRALLSPVCVDRYRTTAGGLAFAVAAIWLVHPLQTQCVNHTIQRSTSLMALCYLLTLYCVQRGIGSADAKWYAVAVGACAVGVGCKEAMVTAPVAVWLYDRTFAAGSFRAALEMRWRLYLGLAVSWILLGLLLRHNPHGDSIDLTQPFTAWHYALNQARIILEHYIGKLFWPQPLTNFYGPIRYLQLMDVWPYALVLCSLLGLTIYGLYRRPLAGFCGGWFFLLLAPTSSLVAIFWEAMAERRPYLALAGLLALLVVSAYNAVEGWVVSGRLSARSRDWICGMGLGVVVIAFGVTTVARNRTYQDLVALWRAEASYVEGVIGGLDEVLPKVGFHHGEVYIRLGRVFAAGGKWSEALANYTLALELYPTSFKAHKYLGHMYKDRDMPARALVHFRRAVAMNPQAYNVHSALGALLCMQGAVEEGIGHLRRALEIFPTYVWAYNNLGAALKLQGRDQEARQQFERALLIAPDFGPAQRNLADMGRE